MDYKFTEKMENDLDQISNGNLDRNDFVKSFWNNFEPIKNNYEKIADENPRNPSEYNFLRTNIICSSDTPCINSETGKEFEENDPPLGDKSLNDNLEKQTRMIWIRFRNKMVMEVFLHVKIRYVRLLQTKVHGLVLEEEEQEH